MKNPSRRESATDEAVHSLGSPCRIVNPLTAIFYRDPGSGRTCLAANSCTPGDALLIDYQTGEKWALPFSHGSGGWDILQIAPDCLLFESLGSLHLIPVDLRSKSIDTSAITSVEETSYAWRFAAGPGGWVYFGSYPTCHLYRYHISTRVVEDLGPIGPDGNLYVRSLAVAADEWVVCAVMTDREGIVAYHIPSGRQTWVRDLNVAGHAPHLCTVGGVVYATLEGCLHEFDTATQTFHETTFPSPTGTCWKGILPTSTVERMVLQKDDDKYYLLTGNEPPRLVWDLPLRGGLVVGVDESDRVVGYRGQDYFVAKPLAQSIEPQPLADDPLPAAIFFLRADPAGGVTGGPSFGQTLFRFDAARDLTLNTPQVTDRGGAVYDGIWVDGKFYFLAYSGGDLTVWDPAQPWDQWNDVNPQNLVSYSAPQFGSLIRPQGGMALGPGNCLYAGWSAAYGVAGGGLSEYNIATGQARAWNAEIFAPDMSVGGIAADEHYVYGSTSNNFNGLLREPQPPVFWVFDPVAEAVVFRQPRLSAIDWPAVVYIPSTGHVWIAEPSGCLRFDSVRLEFVETVPWPPGVNDEANKPAYAKDVGESTAWFSVGHTIVRLDDGSTPSMHVVLEAPEPPLTLCAGADDNLYFAQGVELWAAPLHLQL